MEKINLVFSGEKNDQIFFMALIGIFLSISGATADENCLGGIDKEDCFDIVKKNFSKCKNEANNETDIEKCKAIAEEEELHCYKTCPDPRVYHKCLGVKSKADCQKSVAKDFKDCSDTVTLNGSVKDDSALNKCKKYAFRKNEVCKDTCK